MARDLRQANPKVVMWALDGVLRYVPIAALHDGHQFFIEQFSVAVFTPASGMRLQDDAVPSIRALGFGVTKAHPGFAPLPSVGPELNAIIRESASEEGILPGEKFLDENFTAAILRTTLRQRWPVVHIASHFQFQPGNDRTSLLLLGDGSVLSLAELKRLPNIFANVALLTLSACETGLGDSAFDGTELEAFGVLAQRQGASAVIATLWNVADQSTATLMRDFYKVWTSQPYVSKAEALRQAQLAMLRGSNSAPSETNSLIPRGLRQTANAQRTTHPFYWAPFFLIGNWR
jgi:CHAT domain-containing protein